jgi:primosomal protein N' (replication factor Y) (superfamily II helicase)
LDFDKVSLVGVFNADRMMHFPDFRSYERAYQLITQVSGRAGRREKRGKVVIQTSSPDHPLLEFILNNQYKDFFEKEIVDRQQHGYPPFTRLLELTVKHIDKKICRDAAHALTDHLQQNLPGVRILGPGEPMISKIRNQFLMTILVKMVRGKGDIAQLKKMMQTAMDQILKEKEFRSVRIIADVDPV